MIDMLHLPPTAAIIVPDDQGDAQAELARLGKISIAHMDQAGGGTAQAVTVACSGASYALGLVAISVF